MLQTILLSIVIIGIAIAAIAIKIILKKDGEFRGTCATNNPMLKNEIGDCTVCGKKPEEDCKMPEKEKDLKSGIA